MNGALLFQREGVWLIEGGRETLAVQSRWRLLGAGLAVLADGSKAEPGPPDLEDRDTIVVTALRVGAPEDGIRGIPLDRVPQSIQLLTAAELTDRAARTIGDALRAVPSASPGSPRGVPFQDSAISLRGFAADQMRNGIRQRLYESVDPSALVNVERIEVIKGPSGVLFGQSAVGGLVNIITKRPAATWRAEAALTLGSFDQRMGSVDLTGPLAKEGMLAFRVTGEVERSRTFADFVPLDRNTLGLTLTAAPTPGLSATVVFEWVERNSVGNPGLPPIGTVIPNGIAPIPRNRNLNEPAFAYLRLSAPLVQAWADIGIGGTWSLTPRLSWNGFDDRIARTAILSVLPDLRQVRRLAFEQSRDGSFLIGQLDLTGEIATKGVGHKLLLGVEVGDERLDTVQSRPPAVPPIDVLEPVYGRLDGPPWPLAFRAGDTLRSKAMYVQDVVALSDRVDLVVGLRHARFLTTNRFNDQRSETSFDATVWQLGGTWRLTENWSLFGGANSGLDVAPLLGAVSATGKPFVPETSRQLELGIRHLSDRLGGSLALFQVTRDDVLTADPALPLFQVQTGRQRAQGLEAEGRMAIPGGIDVSAGYAFLASRIVSSNNGDAGDSIADIPRHRATMFLSVSPASVRGLTVRLGANYVGPRRFSNARVSVGPGLLASDVRLPDYAIAQAGARYVIGRVSIDGSITNLFDARYFVRGGPPQLVYPGEPRLASLRLSIALP